MFGVRRIRPGLAALCCAIAIMAGCTTAQFEQTPPGGGASVAAQAVAHRVGVVPATDPAAVYTVRGYLSAVAEGPNAKLVYVWDVTDRQGTRLHRVTGQEIGGAYRNNDPWTGVGQANINEAARKTMESLAAWVK